MCNNYTSNGEQLHQLDWWKYTTISKQTNYSFNISDSESSIEFSNSSEKEENSKVETENKKSAVKKSKKKQFDSSSDFSLDNLDSFSSDTHTDKKNNKKRAKKSNKKVSNNNKNIVKVPARRMSFSDVIETVKYKPKESEQLISLENKSPFIWTVGFPFISLIIFAMEIVQNGGIAIIGINLFIGPPPSVSVLFGAKDYYRIIEGDFWRYLTAIFVDTNIIHLILSVILILTTAVVERDSGFWRAFFVFIISGIYGYILSTMCVPMVISGGFSGALFGYVGLILSDIISSWRKKDNSKGKLLTSISIQSILLLVLGFTPYIDNFPHYGGFIMGFLSAIMLLPNMTYTACERRCHGFTAFLAFPVLTVIFMLTTVFVYRGTGDNGYVCEWCIHLTCININDWCPKLKDENTQIFYWR